MESKKLFKAFVLPVFYFALLAGCGEPTKSNSPVITDDSSSEEEEEEREPEIGDVVKGWTCADDLDSTPLEAPKTTLATVFLADDFGYEDDESICYDYLDAPNGKGYLGSEQIEEPYFAEGDAKNGDIISLYLYVPEYANLASVQLEAYNASMRDSVKGDSVVIEEGDIETWVRVMMSYDSLEMLGAIHLNFEAADPNNGVAFYVDDITIVLGEETVFTDYEYNDESLCETYDGYFRVGSCMSGNQVLNSEARKVIRDNFNSITAENEAKPERILDQKACQELLQEDDAGVAITMKPFEKIYDFCEASHIAVRHHTFVWYSQTPDWFFTTNYTNNGPKASRDLMLARMENFIRVTLESVNDRWPGLVYAVDVANEAVENGGLRTNNNKWYTAVGNDFVYYAFLYANQYKAEDQKLYYNDFAFDYQPNYCRYALNNVLRAAIDEGLIDGVGLQGHLDSNANMDNIISDAKMIYNEGLECQITELDITVNGNNTSALNSQKSAYKNLIKKVLASNDAGQTDINAVIVWGITDNTSWKSSQNPLLFDAQYKKKPAYYGFLDALSEMNF